MRTDQITPSPVFYYYGIINFIVSVINAIRPKLEAKQMGTFGFERWLQRAVSYLAGGYINILWWTINFIE